MAELEARQLNVTDILTDINFKLTSGQHWTLTGPSGGGKSTFLKALASLQPNTSGQLLLDGKAVSDYPINEYREAVSYAVQSALLFGKTVRDNLDLPFELRQQKADEQVQTEFLEKVNLPADYLDRSIQDLSGGQRQRVAVLRNLIFPPEFLLLDEITTGLDEESKKTVWSCVLNEQKEHNFGIISITHDPDEIKGAKHVIEIQGGRLNVK
ncbi:ABC transporter ATP-binding protein [Eupransor demetentiae]|uniref:ATPase component (FetA) n=1 Tax=Eupransor demetentiae TaxID=3109584 RepID=A0ABM9N3I7_9LACO|nr:ABC-type iron transporter FetAB [Lactobacillaceae bacterium LMG 33000]